MAKLRAGKWRDMRIELHKRSEVSAYYSFVSPFLALGLTLVAGFFLFAILGYDPFRALYSYFLEPLGEIWSLHELAIKATPLILIATGLAVCFRSSNWNIGAEGQFIMGGVAGSVIPVMFPELAGPWVLPSMIVTGILGGAAWAAIPALLKTRFGANEILTSLMLVYVAGLFLDWIVRGPWRNPEGYNFPETRGFGEWQILPEMFASGRTHYGALFAVIGVIVIWFMFAKTIRGFEIQVIGSAPRAGRFAGFDPKRTTVMVFLVSGAFAGLAGICEVSGAIQQLRPSISPGYGFTAIIVAFLGRLNPLGILAAGIVLALSYLGSEAVQISLGISDKIGNVFQGLLLFLVLACDTLIHYRIVLVSASPQKSGEGVHAAR